MLECLNNLWGLETEFKKFKIRALCTIYLYISVKLSALLCVRGGGERIEKILPTDRAVPTLFKQIQRKYFFDQGIEFVSVSSVKVFIPTCVILKKDSGDVHTFCTTLTEKTVGEIGILNSDLFSDQFFLQCLLSNVK